MAARAAAVVAVWSPAVAAVVSKAFSSAAAMASDAVRAVSSDRWPYVSTVMPIEEVTYTHGAASGADLREERTVASLQAAAAPRCLPRCLVGRLEGFLHPPGL